MSRPVPALVASFVLGACTSQGPAGGDVGSIVSGAAGASACSSTSDCSSPGASPSATGSPGRVSPLRPQSQDAGRAAGSAGDAGTSSATGNADAGGPNATSDASAPSVDRCDVGVLDAARPLRVLELRGNLGAHDPVIIADDGLYRYFSTGDGISVKTSPDLLQWTQQPAVFPTTPPWFLDSVPAYEPRNIWAPDISFFSGQYHLYYSVSSFGSNHSCIGHATRPSLDTGDWNDQGPVLCSNAPGQDDDFNAIDPNVTIDEAGTPWLAFGSFWSGIFMIQLAQDGSRAGTELFALASRGGGAIEAPFIVRRCGYYYLFVSFDACCQGADSTYNIRVGRAPSLQGPYVGRDGSALLDGGGDLLLAGAGDWAGPGHNAVLIDGTRAYNVYHAYATSNGASQLRIAELGWNAEGWPVSGGP